MSEITLRIGGHINRTPTDMLDRPDRTEAGLRHFRIAGHLTDMVGMGLARAGDMRRHVQIQFCTTGRRRVNPCLPACAGEDREHDLAAKFEGLTNGKIDPGILPNRARQQQDLPASSGPSPNNLTT